MRSARGRRPGSAARPRDCAQAQEAAHLELVGRDGELAAVQPLHALIVSVLLPIPSIWRPPSSSRWQRSWTCGSEAALRMMVVPFAKDRGHQRILGAGDARLVQQDVGPVKPVVRMGSRGDRSRWPRPALRARAGACRCAGGRSCHRPGVAGSPAETAQEWASEQDRAADLLKEFRPRRLRGLRSHRCKVSPSSRTCTPSSSAVGAWPPHRRCAGRCGGSRVAVGEQRGGQDR